MVYRHDTDMEWFRLLMSVLVGVFVGVLVSQSVHSMPIIMASATISAGGMLGLLRAFDP